LGPLVLSKSFSMYPRSLALVDVVAPLEATDSDRFRLHKQFETFGATTEEMHASARVSHLVPALFDY